MNRFSPPPAGPDNDNDDRLLRRYEEANALDDARPGPALREAVLAHARSVAASRRVEAPASGRAPASNAHSWTLRALGSLAVLGLVGLLMLQFDRGSPEEREAAFGGPSAPLASPPPTASERGGQPATGAIANGSSAADTSRPAAPAAPAKPVPPPSPQESADQEALTTAPAAVPEPPPAPAVRPAPPMAAPAPAPMATDNATRQAAETPAAPAAAASPEAAAPAAMARTTPGGPGAGRNAASTPDSGPDHKASRLRREAPASDRAGAAPSLPPLLAAALQGDVEAVRRLLAAGADANARDEKGRTALMLAAGRGDAALIRLLLDAGADAQRRDSEGLSAADHATQIGHTAVLPLLP
jgi:hypothetical protein